MIRRGTLILFFLLSAVFPISVMAEDSNMSLPGGGEIWVCSYTRASDPNNPVTSVPIPGAVIDACTKAARAEIRDCNKKCPIFNGRQACLDECFTKGNTSRLACIRDYCQSLVPGGDPSLVGSVLMIYQGVPL